MEDPTTTASEVDLEAEPKGLSSEPGNVQQAWQELRNATKGASGLSMGQNVAALMLTVVKRVITRVGEDGKGLGEGDQEKAVRQLLPRFEHLYPDLPPLPEVDVQTNTEAENASEQHPPLVKNHGSGACNTRTQPSPTPTQTPTPTPTPTQTQTQTQDCCDNVVGVGDGGGSGGNGGGDGGGSGGDADAKAQPVDSIVYRVFDGSNLFEGRSCFDAMKSDPDHDNHKKRKVLTKLVGSQFVIPLHDDRRPGENKFKFNIKRETVAGLQSRKMNLFVQRAGATGHEHELVAGVMHEKNAKLLKASSAGTVSGDL